MIKLLFEALVIYVLFIGIRAMFSKPAPPRESQGPWNFRQPQNRKPREDEYSDYEEIN